jgi:glycerophosphoryl diester phosphodiesterase
MRNVIAVAHRGAPYHHPENTIDSLRTALDLGADAVETDVRLTRDGVPVLLHDPTLKRLWEHDRPVLALSADEVRGLTGGRVPTLAEALAATDGSRLMLDLPGTPDVRVARRVVDVVRECGAQDRVYYCAGARAQ